ncbi:DUF427-domain-containing protein [Pluteus cervinus]|uniref:DUF427-domain-containing protein n=1 Tax=Pluteus cervinus TaxID=181527 RepID=A0ACD3A5J1_9AGAR|nr:DUF427-domain-containing protein [Pluteus cervinus]
MPPFFSLPHIEDSPKHIRVLLGGKYVIDTKQAKLVWEHTYYPVYFFRQTDIEKEYLDFKSDVGDSAVYDVVVGQKRAKEAAKSYSMGQLAGLIKLDFGAMDSWFEEDEEIFIHPKDPYKRVDVAQSSRHVRVEVSGVEVANTRAPRFLYETGLPVRTYIPKTDCRLDLLVTSDLKTGCPYKGFAQYYHVQVSPGKKVDNIVWWYDAPNLECAGIRGYVAFYDEKVDVWVDGQKQERPKSKWS